MSQDDDTRPSVHSIRESNYKARQITSTANVETLESYQDNIEYYYDREYQHIPIPLSRKYFDSYNREMYEMHTDQVRPPRISLIDGLSLLNDHPFLLLRRSPVEMTENGDVNIVEVPKDKNDEGYIEQEYMVVTLADVNRRPVKDMLYPLIAELATRISHRIEKEYTEERDLFPSLKAATIGHWVKDRESDTKIHIAEYMTLTEMKQIIRQFDDTFKRECGFPSSNNQIEDRLGGIGKLRNRVMHANRSLVHDRNDLSKILERIDKLKTLLETIPEVGEKPTT